MRNPISLALVGSILILGLEPRTWADDAPAEDAAALLRRARVAETVDHDIPKAMALYRKVFAAAGDSDTSRDAALHLMDLLEARGDRPGALGFAKELSDRFTTRLDEAMRRQVHETMARTLPAGSHAKSPLGDVYVLPAPGSASNPSPSPLETKIQAILSRLDGVGESARGPAEAEVLSALRPVGADAVPALERAMNDARPERARFAAQAIARIAPDVALPILLRAIKEGDGFARSAASGGLEAIVPSPSISKEFVAAVEPLLELASLAPRRSALVIALGAHLDASACLDRFERGGQFASAWLGYARQKDGPLTASRLAAHLPGRSVVPDWVVEEVAGVAGVDGGTGVGADVVFEATTERVSTADRLALLEAVARGPVGETTLLSAASIAAAVGRRGEPEAAARASKIAWTLALDAGSSDLTGLATRRLAAYGVTPDADLLAPPGRAERYAVAAATAMAGSDGEEPTKSTFTTLLAAGIRATPAPWDAVERLMSPPLVGKLTGWRAQQLALAFDRAPPPAGEGVRWLRVLATAPRLVDQGNNSDPFAWLLRAAAKTNDVRFVEAVRRNLASGRTQNEVRAYATALSDDYHGPGRGELAFELLEDRDYCFDLLSPWVGSDEDFWRRLLDRLSTYDSRQRKDIFRLADRLPMPPASLDARWLEDLRRAASNSWPFAEFELAAAARSGSPEYTRLLRSLLSAVPPTTTKLGTGMLRYLDDYAGPDRRAFVVEFLEDPTKDGPSARESWVPALWDVLAADSDPIAVEARARITRNLRAPGNDLALRDAGRRDDRSTLIEVLGTAAQTVEPLSYRTRNALIEIAGDLHLREAVPFLMNEYKRGSDAAATSLDQIRTFEERVGAFAAMNDGREPFAAELEAVTKGPTVELRRAAVFALAATYGVKAVPALLEIARTTADESVRAAAIEMIEKLARGTSSVDMPKSPAPAPTTPPAMDGSTGDR